MSHSPKNNIEVVSELNKNNFQNYCLLLANSEPVFQKVIAQFGFPILWSRPANFSTLIHIILEQQVSLASAKAAFDQLKNVIKEVTPENLLLCSDDTLKACYFSRQKIKYARALATAIIENNINLHQLSDKTDAIVRNELTAIKGIGNWTADIYLLIAMQRADVFPSGDLAMMNAIKILFNLPKNTSKELIINKAEEWRPYRSVAAMICWHWYIHTKKIKPPY